MPLLFALFPWMSLAVYLLTGEGLMLVMAAYCDGIVLLIAVLEHRKKHRARNLPY